MLCRYWISQKTGKGDAPHKEKERFCLLLSPHGQKYGVWRDAIRRFCLSKKATVATDELGFIESK